MPQLDKAAISQRAGEYRLQAGGYRAFLPKPLPPTNLAVDAGLASLLSRADRELGRLDGVIGVIPDPDLFVMQYVRREAVLSSQIEGTQASLMDVLEYEALLEKGAATVDVAEIVNYIAAMNHGLVLLEQLPLSRRLISEVHAVLMRDTRGGEPHRTPGEFRRSQNWIGGASPATARFVPPPHELVPELFADLERYLHDPEPEPPLIKAGVAHAQFETIHPFLDGNGRTGRLLITFWLVERKILQKPVLYPSLFFKENKEEYVARLQAIRDTGDWEGWLAFFIEGIAQTAKEATETAHEILRLRERDRARIHASLGRRAPNALALLDALLKQPIMTPRFVQSALNVSQPTASALVRDLAQLGILEELTGRRRDRVFAYRDYLRLFPGASKRG